VLFFVVDREHEALTRNRPTRYAVGLKAERRFLSPSIKDRWMYVSIELPQSRGRTRRAKPAIKNLPSASSSTCFSDCSSKISIPTPCPIRSSYPALTLTTITQCDEPLFSSAPPPPPSTPPASPPPPPTPSPNPPLAHLDPQHRHSPPRIPHNGLHHRSHPDLPR